MKKVILMLFFFFLLILPLLPDANAVLKKEFKVNPGEQLELNLKSGGSIQVTGWERSAAAIEVLFKDGRAKDWQVTFTRTAAGVKVESRPRGDQKNSRKRGPEFKIQVPTKFDLKLKTMGGAIRIAGVEGEMEGRTIGGELDLKELKGRIDLKTLGGDIVLKNSEIDGKVKTLGGRVLIEDVIGDIKGNSLSGNVVYRNVRSRGGKSVGDVVHISTMGGSINVSDAPEGADVHTLGGNIHIRSAKKFVKAKTLAGNITVDAVDGWVKATTVTGNIDVAMTGDPQKGDRHVTLSSMKGNISLAVPAELSMDIDIELAFTKKSGKKHKIVSDFALKETETDRWLCVNGLPTKSILGKAVIKGGKNKIKIKTADGSIYLKKSKK